MVKICISCYRAYSMAAEVSELHACVVYYGVVWCCLCGVSRRTEEDKIPSSTLLVTFGFRQKKVKTFLRSRRNGPGRHKPKKVTSHTQVSLCLYHGYAFVVVLSTIPMSCAI